MTHKIINHLQISKQQNINNKKDKHSRSFMRVGLGWIIFQTAVGENVKPLRQ